MLRTTLLIFAIGFTGACTAHVHGTVHTPSLVAIGPGIWVIEDHHEPVFYSDSYYWLWSGGVWYRSHVHTGSWVRVRASVVPTRVRRIDRPRTYVHYHGKARVRRGHNPPGHHRATHRRRGPPDHARGHNRGRGHGRGHR